MRRTAVAFALVALLPAAASGAAGAPAAAADGPPAWELSLAAYAYLPPDGDEYLQPTVTADRGRLHLEGRHNYEDRDSASLWVGINLAGGETLEWELTPMLGVVAGDSEGIAPGYKGSLAWGRFELYGEGEYVFDRGAREESFFYNWSELTFAPVESFRFGLVTQRTRAYESAREIERGLLLGVSLSAVDLTACLFSPDTDAATMVVAAAFHFSP